MLNIWPSSTPILSVAGVVRQTFSGWKSSIIVLSLYFVRAALYSSR